MAENSNMSTLPGSKTVEQLEQEQAALLKRQEELQTETAITDIQFNYLSLRQKQRQEPLSPEEQEAMKRVCSLLPTFCAEVEQRFPTQDVPTNCPTNPIGAMSGKGCERQ